ncbi:MAG: putative glutamine amidotransferase [Myxococcota bacterium]|jgi:putative glutamine amidotransferase
MQAPIIGISANLFAAKPRDSYTGKALQLADQSMVDRVLAVGGLPIIVPITCDPTHISRLSREIDGLILSGGADVDPTSYGSSDQQWPGQPRRDRYEVALIEAVRERDLPILAICRGIQILNVAFGGTLLSHLPSDRPGPVAHRNNELYDGNTHGIRVAADSIIADILGAGEGLTVNSVHHQGIDRLGDGLDAVAWAPDGLIEAVVAPADRWTVGVQWHPEWDARKEHVALFERFVEASR